MIELQPQTALDWSLRAISLFTTIILLWLGVTIGLNAERRRWGTWIMVAGLLLAGVFFAAHTAIIGQPLRLAPGTIAFWWRAFWLPFLIWPWLWYLALMWYTGALADRWQRGLLVALSTLGGIILLVLAIPGPFPSYADLARHASTYPTIGSLPVVIVLFPLFGVVCNALGLAAVRFPGASERVMGDAARQRARPWLVAASAILISICGTVGLIACWLIANLVTGRVALSNAATLDTLLVGDAFVCLQIAAVVICMGQAIVAYGIFTGAALPRGGLARQWQNVLLLAAGSSVLIAASLTVAIDPVWQVVLAIMLLTVCYAFLSWQSLVERRRGIDRLRPFVTSQGLYDALVGTDPAVIDSAAPFAALCATILDARCAYLIPLGSLATLTRAPLCFPAAVTPPPYQDVLTHCTDPADLCFAVDPATTGEAIWAIPLWNGARLLGLMLLGAKQDGDVYTQEEIALARAAGERLLDTQASAALARRLMDLQRQRFAESEVIDQRTRRVLHDEVLPLLHAAVLRLDSGVPQDATSELTAAHRQIADLLHDLPAARMYELEQQGLLGALRELVTHDLARQFAAVGWEITPEAEQAAASLTPLQAEVVFGAAREAMRNAIRHGPGTESARPVRLTIAATGPTPFTLTVADDGVGRDGAVTAGTGHGLALHTTLLAIVGGQLAIEPNVPTGTRVTLTIPLA